jgi:tetratricopeptide (TPR) repeat protein
MKEESQAMQFYQSASEACSDYCFPHRLEDIIVLRSALTANNNDAKGWYYLGNLWYDKRQYTEAVFCWEKSRAIDSSFATVHRNLSLAYFNKLRQPQDALNELEEAYRLNEQDARVFMELDQLRKKIGYDPALRVVEFEKHYDTVQKREDLLLEYITLQNALGNFQKALSLIESRNFHPWEGGEGKVPAQYTFSLVELAKQAISQKDGQKAVNLLTQALTYPYNLGEGKLAGAQDNNVYYYLGIAFELIGENEKSRQSFQKAAQGLDEPAGMMFYNDQPPETIFYQGLALQKLNLPEQALSRFNKLINYGENHIFDKVKIDYFAVSLPDLLIFDEDLDRKNQVHCLFMMGLGALGKGNQEKADRLFAEAAALDPNHLGIRIHQKFQVW